MKIISSLALCLLSANLVMAGLYCGEDLTASYAATGSTASTSSGSTKLKGVVEGILVDVVQDATFTVTGQAAGNYISNGVYRGYAMFTRSDGSYFMWRDATNRAYISPALGKLSATDSNAWIITTNSAWLGAWTNAHGSATAATNSAAAAAHANVEVQTRATPPSTLKRTLYSHNTAVSGYYPVRICSVNTNGDAYATGTNTCRVPLFGDTIDLTTRYATDTTTRVTIKIMME